MSSPVIAGALDRARREDEPAPGLELDAAVRQRADADLRAREILEDCRGVVVLRSMPGMSFIRLPRVDGRVRRRP
jgi:hypothetical protein